MNLHLQHNFQAISANVDLERRAIRVSAQRALNDAARKRRTQASKMLRGRYPALKVKDANDAFDVRFATPARLEATIAVRGRPFSVARFFVRQDRRPGGGVVVNIKGTRKTIRTAFVVAMKNKAGDDYNVVFARTGRSRYPLKALRTIDLPSAVNIKELVDILDTQTGANFDAEFARQLQLALNRKP